MTEATFWHVQQVTHNQLVERMQSVSHIAALPPATQIKVIDEIREVLGTHPDTKDAAVLPVRYRVDVMWLERR